MERAISEGRSLIKILAPTAELREIVVGSSNDAGAEFPMSVDIELDTANAILTVHDEYGESQIIRYC